MHATIKTFRLHYYSSALAMVDIDEYEDLGKINDDELLDLDDL